MKNTIGKYQHFVMIFIVRKKSAQGRKALTEVRKLSFVCSYNLHRLWEWSINSKTDFVASYFLKQVLFSIFILIFQLQEVYLDQDGTEILSWKFWSLTAELDGTLQPK